MLPTWEEEHRTPQLAMSLFVSSFIYYLISQSYSPLGRLSLTEIITLFFFFYSPFFFFITLLFIPSHVIDPLYAASTHLMFVFPLPLLYNILALFEQGRGGDEQFESDTSSDSLEERGGGSGEG